MAIIEPPKDAKGREIPLDVKVLYNKDGNDLHTDRATYMRRTGDWWFFGYFGSHTDTHRIAAADLYLTPPDSWEKLEEDLDRAVENGNSDESDFGSMACAYMNHSGDMCDDCKFWNKYVRDCTNQMLEDVVSRIRELRSDSE